MSRPSSRLLPRWFLVAALIAAGIAGAQITFGQLNLAGKQVQSVDLYGAEYASQATLSDVLDIQRDGGLMWVKGYGHTLLLPIDEDQVRSTTDYNTVQLDAERVKARTATWVNGNVYLPLDTLARGLGVAYKRGEFTFAAPVLQSVSSRAGSTSDRLVLDLNRNVTISDELRGTTVRVTLKNTSGDVRRYTTRGAFVPYAEVTKEGAHLVVSFPLPQNSGYRVYPVVRAGSLRIVIDAGPGITSAVPVLMQRLTKPLIVLDPEKVVGLTQDAPLEVARRAAELLAEKGWQVKLTRDRQSALPLKDKLTLARQSDVYLSLDLGRFPGTTRSGVTVYEQSGRSTAEIINKIRNGSKSPFAALAVGNVGGTRRLSELLRGELKAGGVNAKQDSISRLVTLSETGQAAMLLELGWMGSPQDRANLATEARLEALSVAVARSVATYLTARANNSTVVAKPEGTEATP